jgi:hypothetical protein
VSRRLEVDPDSLRAAAGSSEEISAGLVVHSVGGAGLPGNRPSQVAVGTLDAVIAAVRGRQADRIASQARGMMVGSGCYSSADESAEGNIAEAV